MKYHAVEKGAVRFGSKDCGVAAVKRASSKSQGGDLAASERRHRAGGGGVRKRVRADVKVSLSAQFSPLPGHSRDPRLPGR